MLPMCSAGWSEALDVRRRRRQPQENAGQWVEHQGLAQSKDATTLNSRLLESKVFW